MCREHLGLVVALKSVKCVNCPPPAIKQLKGQECVSCVTQSSQAPQGSAPASLLQELAASYSSSEFSSFIFPNYKLTNYICIYL